MLKFKKLFTCFMITLILLSSSVLATNEVMPISEEQPVAIQDSPAANEPESMYEDLYIYNVDSYTLSDNIYGNIYASTTKFVTNPRNNGGNISGNLFVLSSEVIIGSDVSYSDAKDKENNYIISSVNSKTIIEGNVYVCADSFTMEAGSEIHGDLYVASTKNINIQQDAVIKGNIYATGSQISLNGQVSGSAYITGDKFDMNYFSYISRDLYLNSGSANLAGVIYRNAFVTVTNKLVTTSYFRVNQNLSVDYADNFTFSGEVKGNAYINSKALSFNNKDNQKCVINGNLKYATQNDTKVADGIVSGEVSKAEFKKISSNDFSVADAMFNFIVLLVYVLVVVLLSTKLAPSAIEKLSEINVKNAIISFAIGFASILAIVLLFLMLLVSGAGTALAFLLVIAYLFVLGLALPILFYNIANMLNFKLHLYVKILIVTAVYYLISLIPVIGSPVVFITLFIGVGRILKGFFSK